MRSISDENFDESEIHFWEIYTKKQSRGNTLKNLSI